VPCCWTGADRGNAGGVIGRVVAVCTESAWRRRGLVGVRVGETMARAADQGVRAFRLAASADGARLYRAIGFRPHSSEMVFKR